MTPETTTSCYTFHEPEAAYRQKKREKLGKCKHPTPLLTGQISRILQDFDSVNRILSFHLKVSSQIFQENHFSLLWKINNY
jgi:hypothetical protein